MVIGRKTENGVQIVVVILADGEFLPDNLNHAKVVAFRQGESTNRELRLVKELGKPTPPELLRPPPEPVCNYDREDGDPLHEHADGTFWFYEQSWNLENGPYATYDSALDALQDYCVRFQQAQAEQVQTLKTLEDLATKLNLEVRNEEVVTETRLDNASDSDHSG